MSRRLAVAIAGLVGAVLSFGGPASAVASPPASASAASDPPTLILDAFEGTVAITKAAPGLFPYGYDAASTPTLAEVEARDRPGGTTSAAGGNHALSVTARVANFGGFAQDLPSAQDWTAFDGFGFWVKGTGSGKNIEFEVKAGGSDGEHAELWQSSFTDDSGGWKQVKVRFADMTRRTDRQNPGAPTDTTLSTAKMWGYAVEFPSGTAATMLFDDVEVFKAAAGSRCLDLADDQGSVANGAKVDAWDCTGSPAQKWTYADGLLQLGGKCMDAADVAGTDGYPVRAWDCDGGPGQKWTAKNGQLISDPTGGCLTAPGADPVNGTQLVVAPCVGGANQTWGTPLAPTKSSKPWVFLIALGVSLVVVGLVFALAFGPKRARRMWAALIRAFHPIRGGRALLTAWQQARIAKRLLADPATLGSAGAALAAAGRGDAWWPYAAVVSEQSVTVWLAGREVPEPVAPWRADSGDARSWTAARSAVDAVAPDVVAEIEYQAPVVLGTLADGVVVFDVSEAYGTLVVTGDQRRGAAVRDSLAEQLDGGEILLRSTRRDPAGGRPVWTVGVDAQGWISLLGRRFRFQALSQGSAAEPKAKPAQRRPARGRTAPGARGAEAVPTATTATTAATTTTATLTPAETDVRGTAQSAQSATTVADAPPAGPWTNIAVSADDSLE